MEFEPIKARPRSPLCTGDKLFNQILHLRLRHGLWKRPVGQVGRGGGRQQRPIVFGQWLIHSRVFPWRIGAALRPRMADLNADLCIGLPVYPVDDSAKGLLLGIIPEAGTAGCDAALGARGSHLDHDQASAAQGPCAKMDQVEVARDAIDCRVLRHWRDHYAIFKAD